MITKFNFLLSYAFYTYDTNKYISKTWGTTDIAEYPTITKSILFNELCSSDQTT